MSVAIASRRTVSYARRWGSPRVSGAHVRPPCPGMRDRVLTEQGDIRPHVNIFVGTESSQWTGGLATPVPDGAEISILPAVSGG